jgi:cytochrome c peroxidase
MSKITWSFVTIVAVGLALPLSNLVGFSGENAPIFTISGSSEKFTHVSQILQNKCVDCHSPGMTRMPIYANFPIAQSLMAKDIEQASGRFTLTKQVYSGEQPFTPLMLAQLEGVIRSNLMPPNLYLSMHWTDSLSVNEKQQILAWISEENEKVADATVTKILKGESVQPLPLTVDLDAEKVALGQKLFHDTRLSGDDTLSCASCHDLTKGGTDQAKVSTGIQGQKGGINSPTVYNAMYNVAQFWDGRAKDLQEQAAGPVANLIEMGAKWDEVVEKLKQIAEYQAAFDTLYPKDGLTKTTVTDAIATFEKSLVTPNSRFDQYLRGNDSVLNADEKAGYALFKENCTSCHFGAALGGASFEKMGAKRDYFKLRGSEMTEADNGHFNFTKQEKDRYFFKVPVLRNIEQTAPYFHDGSVTNLADVVRIMAQVQRDKELTNEEVNKIVAFLKTLTGEYKGKSVIKLTKDDVN